MAKRRLIIRNEQKEDEGGGSVNLVTVGGVDTALVGAVKYNGGTKVAGNFFNASGGLPTTYGNYLAYDGILRATNLGADIFSTSATLNLTIGSGGTHDITLESGSSFMISLTSRTTGNISCITVIVTNIQGTSFVNTLQSNNVTATTITGGVRFTNDSGSSCVFSRNSICINKLY